MSKNSQIIDVTVMSALFYHSFFKFCDKGDIATFLTYTIDSKMPYFCLDLENLRAEKCLISLRNLLLYRFDSD